MSQTEKDKEVSEQEELEVEINQQEMLGDEDAPIKTEEVDALEALSGVDEPESTDEEVQAQEAELDEETDESEEENLEQLTDDEAISVIESLLFISDRPCGMSVFKNAFIGTDVNTKRIKELINQLQIDMADARRGVTIEEVDGAFQVRTKIDNQKFIKKIVKSKTFKLTGPSLETLAVIAYKQPCVKSDVDEVRGVESGHLVRALMDKGLVAFAGKSDLPGKPMLYKTTRKFLEIFGLRNTNELPSLSEMEDLLPEGIGDEEEKETLGELAGKLSEDYNGNYSVAEEELGKITDQLAGISTNTEFFEEEKRKQKEKADRERAENIQEALDLGEEVEDKDRKWLERYEAKMAAAQEELEKQALEEENNESDLEENNNEQAASSDKGEEAGKEESLELNEPAPDEFEEEPTKTSDPLDLL